MPGDSEGEEPTKTHFRGLHDQKIAILGLTSILKVPMAQLPPTVTQGLPTVVSALVTLQTDLAVNRKRREEEAAEEEEDEDEDEEGEGVRFSCEIGGAFMWAVVRRISAWMHEWFGGWVDEKLGGCESRWVTGTVNRRFAWFCQRNVGM